MFTVFRELKDISYSSKGSFFGVYRWLPFVIEIYDMIGIWSFVLDDVVIGYYCYLCDEFIAN